MHFLLFWFIFHTVSNDKVNRNEQEGFLEIIKPGQKFDEDFKNEKQDSNFNKNSPRISIAKKMEKIDTDFKKAKLANDKFEQNPFSSQKKETTEPKLMTDDEEKRRIPETPKPKRVPIIHVLWPEQVSVSGRMNFTIRVTDSDSGFCFAKIGETIIHGYLDEDGNAIFKAPPHKEGKVPVKFSKDSMKWYGELELEYVQDKKQHSTILSIAGGLLLASAFSIGLFYFIAGKKQPTPAHEQVLNKPSRIKPKAKQSAPKMRILPSSQ